MSVSNKKIASDLYDGIKSKGTLTAEQVANIIRRYLYAINEWDLSTVTTPDSYNALADAYVSLADDRKQAFLKRYFDTLFAEPEAAAPTGSPLVLPAAGTGLGTPADGHTSSAAAAVAPLPDFPAVPTPESSIRNTITKVEKTIGILGAFKKLFIIAKDPVARRLYISQIDRYLDNSSAATPGLNQLLAELRRLPNTPDGERRANEIFKDAVSAIKQTYKDFKPIYLWYTDENSAQLERNAENAGLGINVSDSLATHVAERDTELATIRDRYADEILQHLGAVEINHLGPTAFVEDDENIDNWIRTELLNPNASWMIGAVPAGAGGASAGAGGAIASALRPAVAAVVAAHKPVLEGQALLAERNKLRGLIMTAKRSGRAADAQRFQAALDTLPVPAASPYRGFHAPAAPASPYRGFHAPMTDDEIINKITELKMSMDFASPQRKPIYKAQIDELKKRLPFYKRMFYGGTRRRGLRKRRATNRNGR